VPIYLADSANGPLDDGGLDLARDPRQLDAFQRIGDSGEVGAWPSLIFEPAVQSQGAESDETKSDGLRWNRTIVFADRTWRLEFTPGAGYHGSGFWASRGYWPAAPSPA
jgi:hypothetical protein